MIFSPWTMRGNLSGAFGKARGGGMLIFALSLIARLQRRSLTWGAAARAACNPVPSG